MMTSDVDPMHRLRDMMQDLGFRAAYEEGDPFIRSGSSGLKWSLFHSPGHSLGFRLTMVLDETPFSLEQVNEFNAKYRFVKAYLDSDGDLALESDLLFDIDEDGAREKFDSILSLWDGSLSLLKTVLAKAMNPPAEAEAASHRG